MGKRKYKKVLYILLAVICVVIGIYVQKTEKQYQSFFVERNDANAVMAPTVNPLDAVENKPEKININTDNVYELMELDGIGEKMAERIINYRMKNGDFEVIQDLMRVEGIGEKKFEDIKDKICVE